jgi:hypothetical protein
MGIFPPRSHVWLCSYNITLATGKVASKVHFKRGGRTAAVCSRKSRSERENGGGRRGRDSTIWLTAVISHPQHDLRESYLVLQRYQRRQHHMSAPSLCAYITRPCQRSADLGAGFSTRSLGFKPRRIQVRFMLRQAAFLPVASRFPLLNTIPPLHLTHQSRSLSRAFTLT